MYLGEEIEASLYKVKDTLLNTNNMKDHVKILLFVLSDYKIHIWLGQSTTKKWVMEGYYSPFHDRLVLKFGCKDWNTPHKLTEKNIGYFLHQINTTCQHELLHQYQWLNRDPDVHESKKFHSHATGAKKAQQEYLGNWDEIECQAHDVAMEINYFYPNLNSFDVLKRYFSDPQISIPTLNTYFKAFGPPEWNPQVWKRLFKKVYLWLPCVTVKHTTKDTK